MCTCVKCREESQTKIDEERNKEILRDFKSHKMITEAMAKLLIRECVNRPKGVVPDSVYEAFPGMTF